MCEKWTRTIAMENRTALVVRVTLATRTSAIFGTRITIIIFGTGWCMYPGYTLQADTAMISRHSLSFQHSHCPELVVVKGRDGRRHLACHRTPRMDAPWEYTHTRRHCTQHLHTGAHRSLIHPCKRVLALTWTWIHHATLMILAADAPKTSHLLSKAPSESPCQHHPSFQIGEATQWLAIRRGFQASCCFDTVFAKGAVRKYK